MPLLWVASGFVLGLLLSLKISPSIGPLILLLVSIGCSHLFLRSVGLRLGLPLLVGAGLLLGLARGGPTLLDPPGDLHLHHGRQVEVYGRATDLPELAGGQVRLHLEVVELRQPGGEWEEVAGALLVWARPEVEPVPGRAYPFLAYGDRLTLYGSVEAPEAFEGFDYPRYLASQGIGSIMRDAQVLDVQAVECCGWGLDRLHQVRSTLADSLARALPEPAAGLTQTLLLGLRGGVSSTVTDEFRRSGASHLLAISGLHVGMVLALAVGLSQLLLGRRRGFYLLAPLLLIWAYALLAGASPAVVRASLMVALATGRGASPLNSLALAALLMLAWQPRWLWQVSFQLSFAAMVGMLAVGLPAWDSIRRRKWAGARPHLLARIGVWSISAFFISAGAVLGTLPLVTFNFHQVPLFGIPATLLMLPALPALLVSGFVTGVAEWVWSPFGLVVAWLPTLLAGYLAVVAKTASAAPWGVVRLPEVEVYLVWTYYAVLLGILLGCTEADGFRQPLKRFAPIGRGHPYPGNRRW